MNTSTFLPKNNRREHLLLLVFLLFCSLSGVSQEYTPFARVMFYNVENLFDTQDDPATSDNEFLPNGKKHWTNTRYYQKQNRIAQVIIAAREDDYPDVIGLCEIENQEVLESLLFFTPLNKLGYKIIHKESPDPRGIDVAFLYRNGKFRPLCYEAIPLINSKGHALKTRDILYVKGILGSDTLHFFVNHWPSKYGGISATKLSRATAASTLRAKTDSILKLNNQSRIIIMGDFNDTPLDASIKEVLGAKSPETNQAMPDSLYNLALPLAQKGKGSNKFQGKWSLIDQIMVSGSLLDKTKGKTIAGSFQLFSPDFLLENDEANLGKKPNRTYAGYKYHGGFSDHLPVTVELLRKK
ncbi:MAG TPA: endonuclease [Prolixibacteraceae bacterium]|nr:endonuclease [Prolixibacteraceae bacterium]